MKLLTKEIEKRLPPMGSREFFGLVLGFEIELGYFSPDELYSVKGPGGMAMVERDLYFAPTALSVVRSAIE